ncbi:MAG: DUF2235 domain-containing protein [Actinobacteria bacterium]|nr:DUF2235 domain-containing protein [Actinomycetota bacterium]
MKRLIVCCDGTWNKPDNLYVTNVEKIARTVDTDPTNAGGVQQLVEYISGVGANFYWTDRLLGGAFGLGLFANVVKAYRFLALNYEPGDEIYVFGFSRGAYTARSLVGMVDRVGLLTSDALINEKLPEAVDRYRQRGGKGRAFGSSNEEFKRDCCHEPEITFLGVFDTVGALGVPGLLARRHRFHDVTLSARVACARHALAIDERRIKFEPSLWEVDESLGVDQGQRVKQVWFEGAHSDVGGGYDETGLSDTALLWMADEARAAGLAFHQARLDHYVASGSSAIRHDSMNLAYRLLNLAARARMLLRPNPRFDGSRRVLSGERVLGVRIASSALLHWREDPAYGAANVKSFVDECGDGLESLTESVIALPERTSV